MPDEGAVATLEAPAADSAVDVSSSADSVGPTDGGNQSDTGTADAIDNADTPQPGETGHLRGSELYKSVKDKLKAAGLDTKELRSIRNAIHIADKADKLSGGNLEAFQQTQGLVSKLSDDPDAGYTPEQIIESTLEERKFWREFDAKFEKADRSIVTDMITANPEAFQNLAPAAFDEYAKVNPEGFSAYVAKSAKGYLDSQQIPLQFAILKTFYPSMPDFPGKERVVDAINAIHAAFEGLNDMAAKPIQPKKVEGQPEKTGGLDQREQSLQEREMNITRRDWNAETAPKGKEMLTSEMNRIATAQKVQLDEADKQKIFAAVREEIDARLAANPRYGQAMRAYLQAGNKREYIARAHSEYQKLIPGATQRHTQAVIDQKKAAGAKKPVVNGSGQPAPRQNTPQNGNGNLTQWLSGHPKTLNKRIDLTRTTNGMLQRNECYLVGEKGLFKWRPKTS